MQWKEFADTHAVALGSCSCCTAAGQYMRLIRLSYLGVTSERAPCGKLFLKVQLSVAMWMYASNSAHANTQTCRILCRRL